MVKKFSAKVQVQQQQPRGKQREEPPQQELQPFEEAGSDDDSDSEADSLPSSSESLGDQEQGVSDGEEADEQQGTSEGQEDSDLNEFDSNDEEGEDEDSLELPDDEFDDDASPDDEEQPGGSRKQSQQGQDSSESAGDEDDEDEDIMSEGSESEDELHGRQAGQAKKFSEGGKGASFAKAFAKILQRPVRGLDGSQAKDAQQQLAASAEVPLRGAVGDAAILAESKTHIKRQAEEEADRAASRAAKKARLEARRRGRLPVPKRGQDTGHDQREKGLQRLATRGVVMLFNAVTTAKRAQQEASAAGNKAASKVAKASFLSQIQGEAAAPFGGLASLGGGPDGKNGVLGLLGDKKTSAAGKSKAQQQHEEEDKDEDAPGWQVLQDGFTGLAGSSKMKDWDKKLSDSGSEGGVGAGSDSGSGDDGW